MSLLTPQYRAELSALLSQRAAAPEHLAKGFGEVRLMSEARVPHMRLGRRFVNEDRSQASFTPMRIEGGKIMPTFDETLMRSFFGANAMRFPKISIGPHPDFTGLDFNQTATHYCVSMFVDVVGSTKLSIAGYELLLIRRIKDTVLSLFIQVANFFGGHVHRLQGDAAFLQFVRVGREPSDCIINALNAASMISYLVTHYLADIFRENDLEPLAIRIGLDYGKDDDVLWSHYGLPGCSELTTTSLHTDMAAKLQQKAAGNEVRIGNNIRAQLDLPSEFWRVPTKDNGAYEINAISEIDYRQFIFDWRKFLASYDFVTYNERTKQLVTDEDTDRIKLTCEVHANELEDSLFESHYLPNSYALPKGKGLVFRLMKGSKPYQRLASHIVTWKIVNRGAEAAADPVKGWDKPQVDKELNPYMVTGTAFVGHHYMQCKVQRPFLPDLELRFPLFVRESVAQLLLN
jgi:class 3 adenylate cyclase